jgi:EAL domain-containing protein (putative c-di-GMP-specific phosphodiesterase class I)
LREIIESTRGSAPAPPITESACSTTWARLWRSCAISGRSGCIALDDFGTGFSSLALIKDLPLDAIKIDQAFVRHLNEGANRHLVRMVVAIGNELGLEVVAEGVETVENRDTLLALGCRHMQGFLFSQPLPEPEFLRWVASRTAPQRSGAKCKQLIYLKK